MSALNRSPKYHSLTDPLLSASTSFSWRIRARSRNGIPVSPRLSPFSSFPNRGGSWKHTPNIDFAEVDEAADTRCDVAHFTLPPDPLQAAASSGFTAPPEKETSNKGSTAPPAASLSCIRVEVSKQVVLAGSMIGVNVMQHLITIVSVMFVGRLGKLELASAFIAISLATVLGYDILIGMSSALETLCGQAFGGGEFYKLGVYLQRALILLAATCVPLTLVFLFMEKLLLFFGQDPSISAKAGEYALLLLPSIYAFAVLQPLSKLLQAQSIVLPMVLCCTATLGLHVGVCWLMMYKIGLGFRGAAVATSISFWIIVIFLLLYICFSQDWEDTWHGFSEEAFKDFHEFFRLSLSSGVMVCLEYWCFEILVLFSGLLPNPQLELAAFSICFNTLTLNYMIPFGLSGATSTRVANELGAAHPEAAKLAVYSALGLSIVQTTVVATVLVSARSVWGWLFTNDPGVVEYVGQLMPFVAVTALADGMQGVLSGVARGCGWQELGTYINLGSFYCFGVPVGILSAYVFNLGGMGLWIGLLCALILQTSILLIVTLKTDWNQQAAAAAFGTLPSASESIQPPRMWSVGTFRKPSLRSILSELSDSTEEGQVSI